VVSAEWTAPRLPGEQAQVVAVQRGSDPSPPGGPVVDQVGVVRGRRACDHLVPDDWSPGELDQVRDAAAFVCTSAVPEHPSVVSELVEPAEVSVGNPPLRLSGVAAFGPPPGEFPRIVVQFPKGIAGHHSPVVGSPAPDDRGERGDDRRRVRATQRVHLVREPATQPLDGRSTRRDQQLAVLVAADIEPSGSRGALLCPGPLRTGRARFPGIRLKQAPWATKGFCVGVMAGCLGWW